MKHTGEFVIPPRLHIVLVEPEIPPNTGNIARLCAATCSVLHLVHPLGFSTDDRSLKRAGLDYWPHVEIRHHEDLDHFMDRYGREDLLLFSTRGKRIYTEAPYRENSFLLFGKETRGLPDDLLRRYWQRSFFVPIWGNVRSLNLSTAVGIVAFEALRQLAGW